MFGRGLFNFPQNNGVEFSDSQPVNTQQLWFDKVTNALKRFDSSTLSWVNVSGDTTTTINGSQITKLGVVASSTSPKAYDISIPATTDFNVEPVEVLKFIAGTLDQVKTLCNFNNADSTDFVSDSQVIFDGTMKLKTIYQEDMINEGALDVGTLWSKTIDKNAFKVFEKLEVL
jgi:hypothetical protein